MSYSRETSRGRRELVIALFAISLAVSLFAIPAAGSDAGTDEAVEPAFDVELAADGSATVTLTMTYELPDDAERSAFESIRDDEQLQDNATEQFEQRMADVAASASERVDRPMSITDATITIETGANGDIGIVHIGVTWEGLAAVEDDHLRVTEPFASGFTTDRPLTVTAPDGFELVSVTPASASQTATAATWDADTALDGFEITVERTATDESDDGDSDGETTETEPSDADSTPGFTTGVVAAVLALSVIALYRHGTN